MKNSQCNKCNCDLFDVNHVEEFGINYRFCTPCAKIIESSEGTVAEFIGKHEESWKEKTARLARARRSQGKFLY